MKNITGKKHAQELADEWARANVSKGWRIIASNAFEAGYLKAAERIAELEAEITSLENQLEHERTWE